MTQDEIKLKIITEVDQEKFNETLSQLNRLRNRDVWDIACIWAAGFIMGYLCVWVVS